MSHDCIAGSGVQLTVLVCFLSSPLTSYDIQLIAGSETLFQIACSAGVFWVGETLFVFVMLL